MRVGPPRPPGSAGRDLGASAWRPCHSPVGTRTQPTVRASRRLDPTTNRPAAPIRPRARSAPPRLGPDTGAASPSSEQARRLVGGAPSGPPLPRSPSASPRLAASPQALGARRASAAPAAVPPGPAWSDTEVGVFGIGPAGWVPLGAAHAGKTQYGWDRSPLAAGTEVYSLDAMLDTGWRAAPTRERLELVSSYFEMIDGDPPGREQTEALLRGLARGASPVEALELLFPGDGANQLRFFAQHLSGEATTPRLAAQAGKVDAIASGRDATAIARFDSKKGLVDLLQENVRRSKAGEPLIPVYLALRKRGADADSHFEPDTGGTRAKSTEYTTDREIRMIYKLTEELPSEGLRDIARRTFFFVEQDATDEAHRSFAVMPRPWDDAAGPTATGYTPDGAAAWTGRTRSGGRDAYPRRAEAEVPSWVRRLETLFQA